MRPPTVITIDNLLLPLNHLPPPDSEDQFNIYDNGFSAGLLIANLFHQKVLAFFLPDRYKKNHVEISDGDCTRFLFWQIVPGDRGLTIAKTLQEIIQFFTISSITENVKR